MVHTFAAPPTLPPEYVVEDNGSCGTSELADCQLYTVLHRTELVESKNGGMMSLRRRSRENDKSAASDSFGRAPLAVQKNACRATNHHGMYYCRVKTVGQPDDPKTDKAERKKECSGSPVFETSSGVESSVAVSRASSDPFTFNASPVVRRPKAQRFLIFRPQHDDEGSTVRMSRIRLVYKRPCTIRNAV